MDDDEALTPLARRLTSSWVQPNLNMETVEKVGNSKFRKGARVNMAIICFVSFFTVGYILFGTPSRGPDKYRFDLDPMAVITFTYLVTLTNLQQSYMEWPFLDWRPIALVTFNLFTFSLSTILLHAGAPILWTDGNIQNDLKFVVILRLIVWTCNFALCHFAYVWSVRGPLYKPEPGCLSGKYTIITGCNTGIGYLTAVQLAAAAVPDGKIIFACRNKKKATDAMTTLLEHPIALEAGVKEHNLEFMELDVSSMDKVVDFCSEYKEKQYPIDVLLCNAGVIDGERKVTGDGLDNTLAANCLGHFLLVELLMPILKTTEQQRNRESPPRIALVTSALAFDQPYYDWSMAVKGETEEDKQRMKAKPFSMFPNYAQSKYIQMLTAAHLMRKLMDEGSQIPVTAIHPGEVLTEVTREFGALIGWLLTTFEVFVLMIMKSPLQGSQGNVFACTSPQVNTGSQCKGLVYMMRLQFIGNAASWENVTECKRAYDVCTRLTDAQARFQKLHS